MSYVSQFTAAEIDLAISIVLNQIREHGLFKAPLGTIVQDYRNQSITHIVIDPSELEVRNGDKLAVFDSRVNNSIQYVLEVNLGPNPDAILAPGATSIPVINPQGGTVNIWADSGDTLYLQGTESFRRSKLVSDSNNLIKSELGVIKDTALRSSAGLGFCTLEADLDDSTPVNFLTCSPTPFDLKAGQKLYIGDEQSGSFVSAILDVDTPAESESLDLKTNITVNSTTGMPIRLSGEDIATNATKVLKSVPEEDYTADAYSSFFATATRVDDGTIVLETDGAFDLSENDKIILQRSTPIGDKIDENRVIDLVRNNIIDAQAGDTLTFSGRHITSAIFGNDLIVVKAYTEDPVKRLSHVQFKGDIFAGGSQIISQDSGFLPDTIPGSGLQDNTIESIKIQDAAITSAKVANSGISSEKINLPGSQKLDTIFSGNKIKAEEINQTPTLRFATDAEKSDWNSKVSNFAEIETQVDTKINNALPTKASLGLDQVENKSISQIIDDVVNSPDFATKVAATTSVQLNQINADISSIQSNFSTFQIQLTDVENDVEILKQ